MQPSSDEEDMAVKNLESLFCIAPVINWHCLVRPIIVVIIIFIVLKAFTDFATHLITPADRC